MKAADMATDDEATGRGIEGPWEPARWRRLGASQQTEIGWSGGPGIELGWTGLQCSCRQFEGCVVAPRCVEGEAERGLRRVLGAFVIWPRA